MEETSYNKKDTFDFAHQMLSKLMYTHLNSTTVESDAFFLIK